MNIKKLRTENNMTQQQLADLLDVPVRTVQGWESKARPRTPDPRHAAKLELFFSRITLDLGVFDLGKGEAVLFRNYSDLPWHMGFFAELITEQHEDRPFMSREGVCYAQVAPLKGNENKFSTDLPCIGSWDLDRLRYEGLIE